MGTMSNNTRLVCVFLWQSDEADINPFGENRRLIEMIEGAYGGQRIRNYLDS